MFKEALIKSIQDLSEHGIQKCDFCIPHKINDLQSLILTAHPCTVGTSDLIKGSLTLIER